MALPCERLMSESMSCSYAGKSRLSTVDLMQVFCSSKNVFPLKPSFYEDYKENNHFQNGLMLRSESTMKP